jgi:hypothetical protein
VNDPEIRSLLDKAEALKAMSERLIEQGRKLREQADKLIAESAKLTSKGRRIAACLDRQRHNTVKQHRRFCDSGRVGRGR